ncbi:MAG: hypothetical protein M1835_008226 [Candelina submexicana]|nr:MAG: hypothetical protein M1835_008226 [Candelina submexicana]
MATTSFNSEGTITAEPPQLPNSSLSDNDLLETSPASASTGTSSNSPNAPNPAQTTEEAQKRIRDTAADQLPRRKKPKTPPAPSRWMYLPHFSNKNWDAVTADVYPSSIGPDSEPIKQARQKIIDNVRNWQCRMIKLMREHWFESKFTKENFIHVFFFLRGYIYMDKTTPTGMWYLRSIYANLAAKIKLHLDWEQNGQNGFKHSDKELHRWIKVMSTHKEFQRVNKKCFKEKFERGARQQHLKDKGSVIYPEDDEDFSLSEPPPDIPGAAAAANATLRY